MLGNLFIFTYPFQTLLIFPISSSIHFPPHLCFAIKISVCCSDIFGHVAFHWGVADLSEPISIRENGPFISCWLAIVNISSAHCRTPCLIPLSVLQLGLSWTCTGLVRAAAPTVCSYGQLP